MGKQRWRPETEPIKQPTRADSVQIYEAILQAAAELAEDGAAACSTNAIAARAGVGVASVYRYFPGREAILAEVHRCLQVELLDNIRGFLRPEMPLSDAISGCCRLLYAPPDVSPALRRTLMLESPLAWTGDVFAEVHANTIEVIYDFLAPRSSLPESELRGRIFMAFSATLGMVRMYILHPELAPPLETLIAESTRMIYAGLRDFG